jgi:hypothetical protein
MGMGLGSDLIKVPWALSRSKLAYIFTLFDYFNIFILINYFIYIIYILGGSLCGALPVAMP